MDGTVPVEIIDYEERYKQDLEDISLPWLLEYDLLEPVDLEMLADPHRFVAGGGRVLLARWGREIAGMVMLELQGGGVCEALKFGVKEAYRERGIGTALMEAVIQAARDAGQKTMVITSNHKLKAALRIYESLGFDYVTYSDKWFPLSDIKMELELEEKGRAEGASFLIQSANSYTAPAVRWWSRSSSSSSSRT